MSKEININEMEQAVGGRHIHRARTDKCEHDYILTGKECEDPFFIFWTRHKKEKICTKCGKTEWVHED